MKNIIKKQTKLSFFSLTIALAIALSGCAEESKVKNTVKEQTDAVLPSCEDLGEEYIDSFVFLGESTTAHLKTRGVLRDGRNTTQVWAPKSFTMNLDTTSASVKIVYPQTQTEMTVGEAAALAKPRRMLLTFGLNGAVQKVKMGEEYFKSCYRSLISAIIEASPNTEIILQSCFPVAKSMDMSAYTVDVATLNSYVKLINSWSLSLAGEMGLGYLDSWEIMIDSEGFLKEEYQAGDGYHLTAEAYEMMLMYMRTHGTEDGS